VDLTKSFNPGALLDVTLLKAGTSPFYEDLLGAPAAEEKLVSKPKQTPKLQPQPQHQPQSVSASAQPPPAAATEGKAVTDWKSFVAKVKTLNPVVGSKLEVCSYKFDSTSKVLSVFVDDKNSFLRDQVKDPQFIEKVQNYLRSFWSEEVTITYGEAAQGHALSMKDERAQKVENKEAKMKENVENHSLIKSMREKYKVEIKNIKEIKK